MKGQQQKYNYLLVLLTCCLYGYICPAPPKMVAETPLHVESSVTMFADVGKPCDVGLNMLGNMGFIFSGVGTFCATPPCLRFQT